MADAIYPVGSTIDSTASLFVQKFHVTGGGGATQKSIRVDLPENGSTVLGYFAYHVPSGTATPGKIYTASAMFKPDATTYRVYNTLTSADRDNSASYSVDIRMDRESTVCVVEKIDVSPLDIIIIKI